MKKSKKQIVDLIFKYVFFTFALLSIISLLLITGFIFVEGAKPFISGNINILDFLFGMQWTPTSEVYGIGYMILGTIFSTLLAMIITIPISILTAIAISELLNKKAAAVVSSGVELLAGIPSIIYGIVGLAALVPFIQSFYDKGINPFPYGNSLLAVSIVLAIMTLPTIVSVSVAAINAVPSQYKEASLGLGASRIQTIFKVTLPAAKSGIIAGIVLGIGRAVGETIAVVMVAGNVSGGFNFWPFNTFIFQGIRPLTASIAVDIGYASGTHREALFSTALVLFFFIFLLNVLVQYLTKKGGKK